MSSIRAVAFDVFGTLVEIRTKLRPFVKLLDLAKCSGLDTSNTGAAYVMAHNIDLAQLAVQCGLNPAAPAMQQLEDDLRCELESIALFAETAQVLLSLKEAGYKIALCSNLAAPYGPTVKKLLPYELDAYCWSYEVGSVKPQPAIYQHLVESLDCTPDEILFVGDTYEADFTGPTKFGLAALHLDRSGSSTKDNTIMSLTEVLTLLGKHEK